MTHDYKRHGTTTLFGLSPSSTARSSGRNMHRLRHQELIRFLNTIEAVENDVDDLADRLRANVRMLVGGVVDEATRVLSSHFTPTSCSWLNAVEGFLPSSAGVD